MPVDVRVGVGVDVEEAETRETTTTRQTRRTRTTRGRDRWEQQPWRGRTYLAEQEDLQKRDVQRCANMLGRWSTTAVPIREKEKESFVAKQREGRVEERPK